MFVLDIVSIFSTMRRKKEEGKKKQEIRKGFQTTFNCFKANNKSTIVKPEDQKGIRSSKPRLIEPVYLDRCHFHFVCTKSTVLYIESRVHAAIKLKTKNIHSLLWWCYEKQAGFLYVNRLSGVTIAFTWMFLTLLITSLIVSFFRKTLSQRECNFSTKKNWPYATSAVPEIDPTIPLGFNLNRERQSMTKAWSITAQHGSLLKHRRSLLLQHIRTFLDLVFLFMFCFAFS